MKNYSLVIASPVYPKTTSTGNVIAPGTKPTRVVRVKTAEDYSFDFNVDMLLTGRPIVGMFKYAAQEANVEPKQLMAEVIAFAKGAS